MSSEQDYCSPDDSARERLRRSMRITRYSIRKTKTTFAKKSYTEGDKKSMCVKNNEKLPPDTKQKSEDKSDKREARSFSGEPLNPEELHNLFIKFKEDGHFRYKLSTASSSEPVVASAKDIRPATKRKKHHNVITAAVSSTRTNRNDNVEKNATSSNAIFPEAITSLNPLPHATGSKLQINTSKSQYVPTYRSEHHNNWNGPIICRNFLSSGSFREGNGISLSWDGNSFPPAAPSKPCQYPTAVNPSKPMFKDTSISWKSFERENGQLDNRNNANSCGFYSNRDKSQTGSYDNSTRVQSTRSNRDNTDNSYVNCTKLRSVQTPYNNVSANFNENGSTAGASLGKEMSSGNSAFVTPNEDPYRNSANVWNVTASNVPNSFAIDNSSMQHLNGLENTMNYVSSDFGYNNENKSSNDLQHRSHGFGTGTNSGIGYNNNYNAHYLMTWKSLQVFPNPYSIGNDSYVNDASNCPITPVLPSMFVNEPGNFVDQTNCWLQNNLSDKENFLNTGNGTSLPVDANNFANLAPPTTTDESTVVTRINTNDKADLYFDNFPDTQDRTFCPTVSSIGSYDDDINYEACLVIDENSVSTATTPNHELILDPLATMTNEVRPIFDPTTSYSQYNNNCRFNNETAMLYNFDTKAELAGSPDCVIIPNSTRA